MPIKTCSVCSREMSLSKNPLGLVIDDEHFICEDCCRGKSDEELASLTKTRMNDPSNGMPIALWLIHEQNKDKTMMTVKKL